jgi:hypothetical protein
MIQSLLSMVPNRVEIRPSSIPSSGYGVYAQTHLECGQMVALYPGVYTPPTWNRIHWNQHPGWSRMGYSSWIDFYGEEEEKEKELYSYLANQISPSGVPVEENAYILNLQNVGGYLDGNCLTVPIASASSCSSEILNVRKLDENPSACGHLVNHSSDRFNVAFESFLWDDILLDDIKDDPNYYKIPNVLRQDGTPWYFNGEKIVYFEKHDETTSRNYPPLGGAVLITQCDVEKNEELLVHYRLKKPYPKWAKDWYQDN